MSLGLVLSLGRVRQQSLVLVGHANVVHLRNPERVENRSCLRARIIKARDFSLVWIVQIRKRATGPDHAVRGKLGGDTHIPRVAEAVGNRRNHGKIRLLRSAGDGPSRCQIRLVKHVGAFLEAVSSTEGHVRAQAVLEIDRRVLVRLVKGTLSLIEREPRRISRNNVQSRRRFVQRYERRYRITHIAHRLAVH